MFRRIIINELIGLFCCLCKDNAAIRAGAELSSIILAQSIKRRKLRVSCLSAKTITSLGPQEGVSQFYLPKAALPQQTTGCRPLYLLTFWNGLGAKSSSSNSLRTSAFATISLLPDGQQPELQVNISIHAGRRQDNRLRHTCDNSWYRCHEVMTESYLYHAVNITQLFEWEKPVHQQQQDDFNRPFLFRFCCS